MGISIKNKWIEQAEQKIYSFKVQFDDDEPVEMATMTGSDGTVTITLPSSPNSSIQFFAPDGKKFKMFVEEI